MATPKKVDDVSKPGETPAQATSRPIIVGHGAPLKDPMVTNDAEPQPAAEASTPPTTAKKVIEPLQGQVEPANDDKEAKPAETKETEPAKESSDEISDAAVVDAVVDQVNDKKQAEKQVAEVEARQKAVDALVAQKKYFLPIHATAVRNNRIGIVLILVLVLAALGAVAAIDAGLIETNITLPFDLIK